MHTM